MDKVHPEPAADMMGSKAVLQRAMHEEKKFEEMVQKVEANDALSKWDQTSKQVDGLYQKDKGQGICYKMTLNGDNDILLLRYLQEYLKHKRSGIKFTMDFAGLVVTLFMAFYSNIIVAVPIQSCQIDGVLAVFTLDQCVKCNGGSVSISLPWFFFLLFILIAFSLTAILVRTKYEKQNAAVILLLLFPFGIRMRPGKKPLTLYGFIILEVALLFLLKFMVLAQTSSICDITDTKGTIYRQQTVSYTLMGSLFAELLTVVLVFAVFYQFYKHLADINTWIEDYLTAWGFTLSGEIDKFDDLKVSEALKPKSTLEKIAALVAGLPEQNKNWYYQFVDNSGHEAVVTPENANLIGETFHSHSRMIMYMRDHIENMLMMVQGRMAIAMMNLTKRQLKGQYKDLTAKYEGKGWIIKLYYWMLGRDGMALLFRKPENLVFLAGELHHMAELAGKEPTKAELLAAFEDNEPQADQENP